MERKEIDMALSRLKRYLLDLTKADLEELQRDLTLRIKALNDKIEELEKRIEELERDRVREAITFEARKLGMSEEEFLKMVADFIKKGARGDP